MLCQLRFVSLGLGHVVCANKIYAIVRPDTAYAGRLIKEAKENGNYVDWRRAKETKSLILMDDGKVIACIFTVQTVYKRLRAATDYDLLAEDMMDTESNETEVVVETEVEVENEEEEEEE